MSNDLRTISAKAKDILLNRYKVFSLELLEIMPLLYKDKNRHVLKCII